MANSSGMSEVEAREAEAEQARARLASTLDRLTSPETHEAIRAEVLGVVQGYKDELLKQAETYKGELLHKADEYKGEVLNRAEAYKGELLNRAETYKGEIMERAEQYKGEFLSRADQYKNEALQRAEAYKDEALQRMRDSSRETVHNVMDDMKTRAMNNPMAVALIAGGVGYRLYKHPPITTLLVGVGAAMLMRTPGRTGRDDRTAYRDPYDQDQPRGYVPGGVAGYGYPVEEDAPGSSPTERIAMTARETATQMRDATFKAGSQVSETAARTRSTVTEAAGDAYERTGRLVSTVRGNPLLLALVGLAAGAAVARAARSTDTGDRLVRDGTEMLGRGAREATARVGEMAGQAVENVTGVASAAASVVGDLADTVRTRVPEAASGLAEAAKQAVGSDGQGAPAAHRETSNRHPMTKRARHRARGTDRQSNPLMDAAQWTSREVGQMAERYPLLLSSLGLAAGAAAGAMLRPSATEDHTIGRVSDVVKRRVRDRLADQINEIATAADEVLSSVQKDGHSDAPTRSTEAREQESRSFSAVGEGASSSGDEGKTAVVVERAEDAVAAQAAVDRKP